MPRSQVPRSTRYANVAIPAELLQAVRDAVNDPESYYTSMADLVKEALREKLERLALSKRTSSNT